MASRISEGGLADRLPRPLIEAIGLVHDHFIQYCRHAGK